MNQAQQERFKKICDRQSEGVFPHFCDGDALYLIELVKQLNSELSMLNSSLRNVKDEIQLYKKEIDLLSARLPTRFTQEIHRDIWKK